ncbi:DUF5362 family protein [Luteolibacter soli]|uniref:DUF5362 family protein n=1 Tax=Luteolibacter soli TaxID=3135280 RepID=A0ABU9AQE7_9BACT
MDNPYQPSAYGSSYPTATGYVSPAFIQALAGTKPWVRLCSVLGFIAAGMMIFIALAMMATGAVGGMRSRGGAGAAAVPVIMGVIYLAMSVVYLFPSLKLWKYGSAILRLMSSQSAADLEQALEQQRGFWKFVGILALVSTCLGLLGAVIAGIASVSAVSSLSR